MSRICPDCHNSYDDEVLHCPEDGRGLGDVPSTDELIGRIAGSEARGCSIALDELLLAARG